MQLTPSLLAKLADDFPALQFTEDVDFRWSDKDSTVYYDPHGDAALLLHEIAHAELKHVSYERDITLLEMERDAWDHAIKHLFPRYGITPREELVDEALDTYRDWLHARSMCPHCQSTGIQTRVSSYKCLACGTKWRVNEARICALRRYVIQQKTPR